MATAVTAGASDSAKVTSVVATGDTTEDDPTDKEVDANASAGADDITEDSVSLGDESVKEFPEPPRDYLPVGFITFMTRGPLAPAKNRVDFLSLDDYLECKNSGRKHHRTAQVSKKKEEREFELGKGGEERQSRDMVLGATTQKEIALVAQNQSRITNQAFESEIVKRDMLIKNKQAKVKTLMEMAKIYREMGDGELARQEMKAAKDVLGEMDKLAGELEGVKNDRSANSAEVDEYLRKGLIVMGIQEAARKKAKVADTAGGTYDVEGMKEPENLDSYFSDEQLEKQSV